MEDISDITRKRIATLYPGIRPLVYRVLSDVKTCTKRILGVAQATRTFDEQMESYSKGRQQVDGKWKVVHSGQVVTNARPGYSWHCYGLAWDAAWVGMDPYLEKLPTSERVLMWEMFGKVGKSHGFTWGGDFRLVNGVRDIPHLEMTYGMNLSQCLELYGEAKIHSVWAYLDQLRGVEIGEGWDHG